jgi:uncharacterized membrane protein
MSPYLSPSPVRPDRPSDSPLAIDTAGNTGSTSIRLDWAARMGIPRSWIAMSGYLLSGVVLGLIVIVGLTLTRNDPSATSGVVSDNVVRLHGRDFHESCWRGASKAAGARVTVSLEVGLDGKVRSAVAAGESPTMRSCVESHVKAWEFLPQAAATQMVLPFEIDPR